jgi:hypothetical protein
MVNTNGDITKLVTRDHKWKGLIDNDDWQSGLMEGSYWKEVLFWFGEYETK